MTATTVRRGATLLLLATLLSGLTLVSVAGPASAHDVLRSTNPKDGTHVERPPAEVVLTFDEPALAVGTEVLVTGPSGSVSHGSAEAGGQRGPPVARGRAGRGLHRGLAGHVGRRAPGLGHLRVHRRPGQRQHDRHQRLHCDGDRDRNHCGDGDGDRGRQSSRGGGRRVSAPARCP